MDGPNIEMGAQLIQHFIFIFLPKLSTPLVPIFRTPVLAPFHRAQNELPLLNPVPVSILLPVINNSSGVSDIG
jgi:pilus assembly protein Flp/PilA